MPSQPVVPGQERTAVHHTAALCNMMLKRGCIHQQSSVTRGRSCNISNRGFTRYQILPMWVSESWASAALQKHRLAVSLIFWWRLRRFKCGDSAVEKYDGASCFMKCEPSVTSLTGLWIVKPGVWLRRRRHLGFFQTRSCIFGFWCTITGGLLATLASTIVLRGIITVQPPQLGYIQSVLQLHICCTPSPLCTTDHI